MMKKRIFSMFFTVVMVFGLMACITLHIHAEDNAEPESHVHEPIDWGSIIGLENDQHT